MVGADKKETLFACWDCGALNAPDAERCWICDRADWRKLPALDAAKGERVDSPAVASPGEKPPEAIPSPAEVERRSSIATIMLVIGIIAVVIGLWIEAPGLGILLCVSVLPAFVVLTLLARKRQRNYRPMSVGEKVAIFAALTVFIPIVIALTVVGALLVICAVGGGPDFR